MAGMESCGPGDAKCWNPRKGKFRSMVKRIGKKIRSSFTSGGKEPHKMEPPKKKYAASF